MVARTSKRKQAETGFTLIELLIASSILLSIMFTGYLSYSLFSEKWQSRTDYFWQETEKGIALDLINKLLISTDLYIVESSNNQKSILFQATEQSLLFVSNSPIYSDQKALVLLSVVEEGNKKSLIYSEREIAKFSVFNASTIQESIDWSHEAKLLSDLDSIDWTLFGWRSLADAAMHFGVVESNVKQDFRVEYRLHSIETHRILPQMIKIRLNAPNENSELAIALPQNSIYHLMAQKKDDI